MTCPAVDPHHDRDDDHHAALEHHATRDHPATLEHHRPPTPATDA